jgi:hypothetical protein
MRRALVSFLAFVVVLAVGFAFWRSRPPAPPAKSATAATTKTDTPAIAPATPAAPPPVATPSAAAPSAPTRRRAPAPATETPAAEAAAAAESTTGTLHIDSDVTGAQVFIDRRFIGVVPVTESDVPAGNHRINVVATGSESLAENVDVAPGPRGLHFNFKEIRLDASIAVVHKHRMGSCNGRLIATPQGLRYETTDKDDAFSAPLGDFEIFDVDYLAKELRVKLKKGKRYEFTDPDANADRLFVFQRDVDKVRQRLKDAH